MPCACRSMAAAPLPRCTTTASWWPSRAAIRASSRRATSSRCDLKNQLAAQVAAFADPVRSRRFGQREGLDLRQAQRAAGQQLQDPLEVAAPAIDVGAKRVAGRPGAGRDRSDAAAGAQDGEAALRDIAADGVEHCVAAGDNLGEILRAVVDELVRAKAAH